MTELLASGFHGSAKTLQAGDWIILNGSTALAQITKIEPVTSPPFSDERRGSHVTTSSGQQHVFAPTEQVWRRPATHRAVSHSQ